MYKEPEAKNCYDGHTYMTRKWKNQDFILVPWMTTLIRFLIKNLYFYVSLLIIRVIYISMKLYKKYFLPNSKKKSMLLNSNAQLPLIHSAQHLFTHLRLHCRGNFRVFFSAFLVQHLAQTMHRSPLIHGFLTPAWTEEWQRKTDIICRAGHPSASADVGQQT